MTFGGFDYNFYGRKNDKFYVVLKIIDDRKEIGYSLIKIILMKDFINLCGNNYCDAGEDVWNCAEDCQVQEPVSGGSGTPSSAGKGYDPNQPGVWGNNNFIKEILDDCSKSCCQTGGGNLIKNTKFRNYCYGIIGGRSDLCSQDGKGVYEAYCSDEGCIRDV